MAAPAPDPAAAAAAAAALPHAVVIGSGFGGLAAAVRLGARGYRVTVLERLDAPGGRAYVFRQEGFTFDAGPTIITAPELFEELWQMCGRRLADDVELRALAPYYRVQFADGSAIDWSGDAQAMRAAIARLAPGDVAGYERVMALSERIYRLAFEQLAHVPFDSWLDMARLVPSIIRLRAYRSLHARVAAEVREPRLRFLLSFHPLFVGGNPFTTSALYGLILHLERAGGVHF
ncbi:MAG TPA: phytoene desaturase family protein, partial [Steroidobacteraceae bacterium]|nr:phytoene desaturase family protein [Steroidobacteraceae bacterium]